MWYDGDGDVVPPDGFGQGGGLSQSREYDMQTKVGRQLTANQRLQLTANYYRNRQDADYVPDRSTGDPADDDRTAALRQRPDGIDPGTENVSVSVDHTATDVLGGTLSRVC